jgi:hypothetical protein
MAIAGWDSCASRPARFLAAGFVVLTITYCGRDHDPQCRVSLEECLAGVEPKSIVVYGCSGGVESLSRYRDVLPPPCRRPAQANRVALDRTRADGE